LNYHRLRAFALIALFFILHLPILAGVTRGHPDEQYYTDAAIRMVQTGDYVTPHFADGTPRFNKPGLAYWLVAAGFRVLGISVFASRILFLVAGCLVVWIAYLTARTLFRDESIALATVVLLVSNDEVHSASLRATPDILLCLGITLGLYGFARALFRETRSGWDLVLGYGGVGLGKTHLMNAIGNRVLDARHDVSILYVSSEQFTNEVVSALRHDKMAELKEKYRNLDLLLLDDVQFIAKKTATQEEFFYTFNALYEKQKQIVISCDRPPKEISEVTDRLRSRFNMGLIADIQPPDIETKIAIIYKKAEMMGIRNIPEDVVDFLAHKIKSNIRELEGSLIRIAAQSSLTGEEISLPTTKKVLKDIIHDEDRPVTVEMIQKIVCDFYSITLSDIKARRRTKEIALPRQVAMYLSKQATNASLSDIGKNFGGKDHATVIYACKQVEERRQKDETFNRMIENLLQKITS